MPLLPLLGLFGIFALPILVSTEQAPPYGQLRVQGSQLQNSNGQSVMLRGMSLFWSQWDSKFWNYETLKQLKCKWKMNVIRAPMGVEGDGGYLQDAAANKMKLITVVDAAIQLGIYVIIDWHYTSGKAYTDQAVQFFREMAQKYGKKPHILYEVWNEPVGVDWTKVLAPYHQKLISTIRSIDPDNVILVGTPSYSMDLNAPANKPLTGGLKNIMYSFHFYAADGSQSEQTKQQNMLRNVVKKGLPVFVTESGAGSGGSNAPVNLPVMRQWWALLEELKVSFIIWAVRGEGNLQNPLKKGTTAAQVGQETALTEYGKVVRGVVGRNPAPTQC